MRKVLTSGIRAAARAGQSGAHFTSGIRAAARAGQSGAHFTSGIRAAARAGLWFFFVVRRRTLEVERGDPASKLGNRRTD
ncbi:hypothetical protein AAC387_Pa03g2963 [Persea americana]